MALAVGLALDGDVDRFKQALDRNWHNAHEIAISASSVAAAVRRFASANREWEGPCSELLQELNEFESEEVKRREDWPGKEQVLSKRLRECAPNLRAVGIAIDFRDNERPKRVSIWCEAKQPKTSQGGGGAGGDHPRLFSYPLCYANDDPATVAACRIVTDLFKVWTAPAQAPPTGIAPITCPISSDLPLAGQLGD